MLRSFYNNIKIDAVATAVPSTWVPVEEYFENADIKTINRFKREVGVEGCYRAHNKQTTSDLAYVAATKIIENKGVSREDIGILVFVTQTPDYQVPATACVLQKRLGLSESCIAFDVNQGCAGLVYGINIVSSLLANGDTEYALLMCGDTANKKRRRSLAMGLIDKEDADLKLFGDAGAAVLIQKTKSISKLDMGMCADGNGFNYLIQPYGQERHYCGPDVVVMDGAAVFDFSIDKPPALLQEFMKIVGTEPVDYDCLVLHQSNKLMIRQIASLAGFSKEQNLISIDKFGNTASASIATALTQYYGEDKAMDSIKVLLCGYGIGLAWGVVSAEICINDIFPLILTDEYFDDGYLDVAEITVL